MRKIILNVAVSLDGLIEGPNGEYDWCFTDQDYGFSAFLENIDTILFGRKSYEMVAAMEDEQMKFPNKERFVFSRTLETVDPGFQLVKEEAKGAVQRIKNQEGKDIWLFGGASLTTSLMNLDLVDQLSLAVHPISLGEGKPLFQNIKGRQYWKLLDMERFSSDLVIMTYEKK
jgi:dihydrofolate reductase